MSDALAAFVTAATDGRRDRAEALLAAEPGIAEDPWAALVLGRGWAGDANAPGGPLERAPLLYLCHSVFASVPLARELLARGADPDGTFANEHGDMSALYGAAGVRHDPELTRVLLEAGADPDDDESVYHATEAPDPACLRLLLEHGADPDATNGLAHALDEDRPEHVRLLLDHGATTAGKALVAHAVRRGRSPEVVALLLDHGAPIDEPGGETWRGAVPLRTPYAHARLRNRDDLATLLAGRGADTAVDPADERVAAVGRGERVDAALPEVPDPDQQEALILAALRGHLDAVLDAVGTGFWGVVGGSPGGTLLHHASWVGGADAARRLIAAGADVGARATSDSASPLAWAAMGSAHDGDGEHVAVAEALVAAGADLRAEPLLELADGPLLAWLTQRLP